MVNNKIMEPKNKTIEYDEYGEEIPEDDPSSFIFSAIVGVVTDSAIIGGLLGGDILGGIAGDIIDGDLFD